MARARVGGVVVLEPLADPRDELRQRGRPASGRAADARRAAPARRRVEAVDVGVDREEAVGVPQGEQELAHHLVDQVEREPARVPGARGREQVPAQGVGALAVEHVVGLHHVAAALAHLLAVGVEDVAQAEHRLVGAAALDQGGHRQQAVEPAAGLVDRLGDEVGREPLAERLVVLERIVPLREGHGARVEPGVDHLGHAAHVGAALGAAQHDVVDVGPVQLEVVGRRRDRHLAQLGDAAHAMRVALLAAPHGQRRAPVAVARQGPVDVVLEPLAEAAVLDVLGVPGDGLVGGQQVVLDGRRLHVPGRLGVVEQRRVAAPAERIAVLVGHLGQQQAALLQVGDDGRVGVFDERVRPGRDLGHEAPGGVDQVDTGRSLSRPTRMSSSPKAGAMCTMPVPSPTVT